MLAEPVDVAVAEIVEAVPVLVVVLGVALLEVAPAWGAANAVLCKRVAARMKDAESFILVLRLICEIGRAHV